MLTDGNSISLPVKISEGSSATKAITSMHLKETDLRGVIGVLINKIQRLQMPVLASKKLAKHCQQLKEEVERLKEVSYNYKNGMERAERRSARLQQDLYRLSSKQKAGGDGKFKTDLEPKGLPFFLPESVKQVIDALTAKNVALMKSLRKLNDGNLDIDKVMEENFKMEALIKSLQEELQLKSSLLEDYESEMRKENAKFDEDKLLECIQFHRKECFELKGKIRSYQSYVKHLRERNTAILDTIMTDLDRSNRGPIESSDEAVDANGSAQKKAMSAPVSRNVSRNSSRNGSRRDSLRNQSENEMQSTGMQTDSGASCASSAGGSLDDTEADNVYEGDENSRMEMKKLMDAMNLLTKKLHEKEAEEKIAKQKWSDLEDTCGQMASEIEKLNREVTEEKMKSKKLVEGNAESEAILRLMQERVDKVNREHADSGNLHERIREYEEQVKEMDLVRQVLKNYEEEIKTYGVERNEIIGKQKQLEDENGKLRERVRALSLKSPAIDAGQQAWRHRQPGISQAQSKSPQRTGNMQESRYQQSSNMLKEPWQGSLWPGFGSPFGQQVVADSPSGRRFNNESENLIHQAQRNRQLGQETFKDTQKSLGDGPDGNEEDDEFSSYEEDGTVKCEICGERYPKSLLQDHFRDCSRNNGR